eukprot:CAMPEP_0174753126 /NCGR_PEP_ID=MMETSP1094-20130205/103440_1 /TAXON_ID=156173 /ORGANISM="Chrysochromulina brevifilum, Strain UTEX LB 985" /LENGTH=52 /DNA_ID=CAMNT_0015958853 /DNA_START=253 /DNA_END=411 /DNA_ORIENTATION=+
MAAQRAVVRKGHEVRWRGRPKARAEGGVERGVKGGSCSGGGGGIGDGGSTFG